jgi:hypothetical protein
MKNMKKEELKDYMENILETAKEILVHNENLVPMAFMKYKDNVDIIALSFGDNDEKNRQLSVLKDRVKKKNADAVFVVTESWYVTSNSGYIVTEPSKDPSRKECVLLLGECENGNFSIMQLFDRKDKKIVFGEKIDIGESISSKFDFGIKNRKKWNNDLGYLN